MKLRNKWIVFIICAVAAVLSQFYIQQRYTSLYQVGVEYQWPVKVSRHIGWVPADYLEVDFLGNYAKWAGQHTPKVHEEVYVIVSPRPSGVLTVEGATDETPSDKEYIRAKVVGFENGIVEFEIPFNRVKVDMKKVNPKFYTNYKGILLATLKIRDGYGVVTGVYSKGVPLEIAQPETTKEQEQDSTVLIEEIDKDATSGSTDGAEKTN